jgi:TDG/mug DNA glycosylase family protein
MDPRTVAIYERSATAFAERRRAADPARARAFAARVAAGGVRLDLGCGPGFDVADLGTPVVVADAAPAMVTETRRRHPGTPGVVCDLAALPLRQGAVAGVWASRSLQHLAREAVPVALAGVHRTLVLGGLLVATVFAGDGGPDKRSDDPDFPGRWFSWWPAGPLRDVLEGAGFTVEEISAPSPRTGGAAHPDQIVATAVRARTLPDTVGPRMRLLMCGLNPSLYAADAGVGFARPGNRFWPALRAAGLVVESAVRSPDRALRDHGIGMTDIVKRATVAAAELTTAEYAAGMGRIERLVAWLRPGAVCFVGLAGWRAAVDRRAAPGVQPGGLAGVPVYVMPSTSGLNARTGLPELEDHLRRAARLAY